MKRCLFIAVTIAILSAPSIATACNCQATRAQRYLAYKAYKEKMALERQRLLSDQQQGGQRRIEARREQARKGSGKGGSAQSRSRQIGQ
jgi:hypothetical protein